MPLLRTLGDIEGVSSVINLCIALPPQEIKIASYNAITVSFPTRMLIALITGSLSLKENSYEYLRIVYLRGPSFDSPPPRSLSLSLFCRIGTSNKIVEKFLFVIDNVAWPIYILGNSSLKVLRAV